jgi:solute carrier family 9 (sodium/hydrogen exchanger), member 6/7
MNRILTVPPIHSSLRLLTPLTPNFVEPAEAGEKEIFSSWALFILIVLLILALFTSYILQSKKIQAVHETVISTIAGRFTWILSMQDLQTLAHWCAGMFVGLVIRVSPGSAIQDTVSFNYQFFFNLLLPPIILASGYELHQVRPLPLIWLM